MTRGSSWLVNSGSPTVSEEAIEGDMYLDTSTYNLYQMINEEWVKIGNIKGETGSNGKDGVNGLNGLNGQDGKDGKDGINGLNGQDGQDGITPTIIINDSGYWVINGVQTDIKAQGADGINGVTPIISIDDDGYFVVNGQKTNVKVAEKAVCKATTEENKTTGNVPTGQFKDGDEYICEVKDGTYYHFFVVGTAGNNVSLILDRNINNKGELAVIFNNLSDNSDDYSGVHWISQSKYNLVHNSSGKEPQHTYGPVTAMEFLHNATKDWTNIQNIVGNYEDENINVSTGEKGETGYTGIQTNDKKTVLINKSGQTSIEFENLKARLPKYSEIFADGKCEFNTVGVCPLWLVNYTVSKTSSQLDNPYSNYPGFQSIVTYTDRMLFGYWLMASVSGTEYKVQALAVNYKGIVVGVSVKNDWNYGVRPVIEVPKDQIR